jgi:uncharacterized protein
MHSLFSSQPWLLRLDQIAQQRSPHVDAAHDYLHARRVAKTCVLLCHCMQVSPQVSVAAALVHELFSYAKDDSRRSLSGIACLPEAQRALADASCPNELMDDICESVADHPYSLAKIPRTLQGRILQDADRLDAIGAIGIARCFATGQALGRPFYSLDDPSCVNRQADDSRYTLDHFYRKLLILHETMHTPKAKELAAERREYLLGFLSQFLSDLG